MPRPTPDLRVVTVLHPGTCRTCGGLGVIGLVYDASVGGFIPEDSCPDCDGTQTAKGIGHE